MVGLPMGVMLKLPLPPSCIKSQGPEYGLSPPDFGWFCVLLVAGGVVGPLGWVIWSVVLTCLVAALLVALRSRSSVTPPQTPQITVRGPVSYAGPGSLGGTESALRR